MQVSTRAARDPVTIPAVDQGDKDELLTAEGGVLRISAVLRDKLAVFRSGQCLVARRHAEDHDVISAIALARRLGFQLQPPKYVDLGAIKAAYAALQDGQDKDEDTSDTQMKKELMTLFQEAARVGTSDVHMVVQRGEAQVWLRFDGERVPFLERPWPAAYGHQFCRTAYAVADVADASYEQFAFQAARISTNLPEGIQAVRLQFNPVGFDGRQLVMRLLYSKQSAGTSLDSLGFNAKQVAVMKRLRAEPVGITAVSGPTGSGKSTTLERMLRLAVAEFPGDHILSVEDPPEYQIPGVIQLPVSNARTDEERANAFSEAIAAALRSDPDRIMIGEVRLKASAELAFKAAMTGHAVYTTIHANDALSIPARLMDIGVKDYMLADPSIVKGLTAQRLIRTLCKHCKQEIDLGQLKDGLDERLGPLVPEGVVSVRGPGCQHCREGYTGRSVVAEIICPDDRLLGLLSRGSRIEAEQYWKHELNGFAMIDHALEKVREGVIDPTEIERKVGLFGRVI